MLLVLPNVGKSCAMRGRPLRGENPSESVVMAMPSVYRMEEEEDGAEGGEAT